MRDANPGAIHLKDYQPPAYLINRTELHFDLREDCAEVAARLHLLRSPEVPADTPLRLQGEELELLELAVDGEPLVPGQYELTADGLVVPDLPEQCVLSSRTPIRPQDNPSLEGLYRSHSMFCPTGLTFEIPGVLEIGDSILNEMKILMGH